MQHKRLADDVVGDILRVSVALQIIDADGELPESIAAAFGSGAIERSGTDSVRLKVDGAVVASAGLGDHIAVFDGVATLLSERALLRGYDPV